MNKGNCFFAAKEFEKASDIYMEALSVEADCSEALYNLGLSQARLGDHNGALGAEKRREGRDFVLVDCRERVGFVGGLCVFCFVCVSATQKRGERPVTVF